MTDERPAATLYWRPGCGFCMMLRRSLRKKGIELDEVNIWEDDLGAGAVRAVAGGSETVPTVIVGELGLVNPSASQVIALLEEHRPDLVSGGTSRR